MSGLRLFGSSWNAQSEALAAWPELECPFRRCPIWSGMSGLRLCGLSLDLSLTSGLAQPSLDFQFEESGLKLSDPELLHLTRDLPSALGRYPVRAGLSGLSLDACVRPSLRLGCSA